MGVGGDPEVEFFILSQLTKPCFTSVVIEFEPQYASEIPAMQMKLFIQKVIRFHLGSAHPAVFWCICQIISGHLNVDRCVTEQRVGIKVCICAGVTHAREDRM